jgi:hypothetical protein
MVPIVLSRKISLQELATMTLIHVAAGCARAVRAEAGADKQSLPGAERCASSGGAAGKRTRQVRI